MSEKVDRRSGSIVVFDLTNQREVARWDFVNAWPSRWDAPSLNARGNEVAVETLVLIHEGITRHDGDRHRARFEMLVGYLDDGGHASEGHMRLATAADEIGPLAYLRVQRTPPYLSVILLSREESDDPESHAGGTALPVADARWKASISEGPCYSIRY